MQVVVAARAGEGHRGMDQEAVLELMECWMYGCKEKETSGTPRLLPGGLGTRCQVHSQNQSLAVVLADVSLAAFQVNEIYHDESLGAHINVVLVRIILLSHAKVSPPS